MLVASGLVMLMVPGLALFYGGMVRHKNVLATLMQVLVLLALVSVQWALFGYTLAFGPTQGGLIGGLDHIGLKGVSMSEANEAYAATIPHLLFVVFQGMFAVITPALIVGAFAERMSFKALVVFGLLWATLVYDVVAHWVWGVGGMLRTLGALDFAGGTVVHITAGVAALACVLYMGARKGWGREEMTAHNIPLTVLGAGLLWFGWFGFNAGSALSAGPLAVAAFAATHLAAAAGALSWSLVEWLRKGKPSALGACGGLVAGLVAITPAAGFVTPMSGILIGLSAGALCYGAVHLLKGVLKVDDSLDAFGVHGVGGIWGAVATGMFATLAVNGAGADASPALVAKQAIAVGAVATYTLVATFAILWATDKLVGLRVPEHAEEGGLDLHEHGEVAYAYDPTPALATKPASEAKPDAFLAAGVVLPGRKD